MMGTELFSGDRSSAAEAAARWPRAVLRDRSICGARFVPLELPLALSRSWEQIYFYANAKLFRRLARLENFYVLMY